MKSSITTKKYSKDGKLLTGFTLIELIVVMGVFMFVIGAAIGIFISIVQHQKKILAEQELLNQVSYVEEYMSKAMRMATKDTAGNCLVDNSSLSPNPETYYSGYTYLLTRPVTISGASFFTGIKFLNQSNTDNSGVPVCQEFYLDTSSTPYILKELKTYSPYAKVGDENAVALTSKELNINSIRFGIDGFNGIYGAGYPIDDQDTGLEYFQPRVTVTMQIQIPGDSQEPTRTIQTTVSQRNLNAQ